MKMYIFILFLFLFFMSGCATTYEKAVYSQYLGNDKFEIRAYGNIFTHEERTRTYIYRKAFELCRGKDKGYRVIDVQSRHVKSGKYEKPRAFLTIKCEGKIDPELLDTYQKHMAY